MNIAKNFAVFAAIAVVTTGFASQQAQTTIQDQGIDTISGVPKISVIGTWTVRVNGIENKSIKICFDKEEKFKFSCIGAKSEGTYKIHDGVITLTYLKVDDEPVDFEMKKNLPLAGDATSFEVDKYHYERASEEVKS